MIYPPIKPTKGDPNKGISTLFTRIVQLTWVNPAWAIPPPTSPPIKACDELEGMPRYQVIKFQMMAPISAAMTTSWETEEPTIPDPIVFATAVPDSAPKKLSPAAIKIATNGVKTLVETTVAIAFAVS